MNNSFTDELDMFCPVLADLVRTRTTVGRSGKRFEELGALSSVNNLISLRRLAMVLQPKRTLEVGLSFGGSCLTFAATHRDLGAAPSHQHVALDPFQKQVWDDTGLMAVERAELTGFVDFRPAFSSLELPRLMEAKEQYDLVYIDGSHLFEDVFVDFYFVSRLLSESGVVVFDDCCDPHVRKVLSFIRRNLGSSFVELNLGPYRADGGASIKYRAAKMLARTQMTAFRHAGSAVRPWNATFAQF